MTLKQALDIAVTYANAENLNIPRATLCCYADIAQKEIALDVSGITKRFDITKSNSKAVEYDMPAESTGLFRIIRRGSVIPVNYHLSSEGKLVISDYGSFDIYYNVLPQTITEKTSPDYSFQVDVKTHGAIPFYIAYRISDIEEIAQSCLSKWNKLNSLVKQSVPKALKIRYSDYYL